MTCKNAIESLEKHQIAWSRVSEVSDAASHPALRNFPGMLPDGTVIDMPLPAGHERFPAGAVPSLGQHTEQIMREFAN